MNLFYKSKKNILNIILIFSLISIILLNSCNIISWNKNDNNRIYIPGRLFYFEVNYFDSTGTHLKTEKLELQVTNGFYPARSQTQIIWKLYETTNGDTNIYTNKTGVLDSEERFFIHQPRIRDMYILSFAYFPSISSMFLNEPEIEISSEGTVYMSKSYQGIRIKKVNTKGRYKGLHNVELQNFGTRDLYKIEGNASSVLGTIYGQFYFDPDLGFVKMDYTLPDSSQIIIEIIGTDF